MSDNPDLTNFNVEDILNRAMKERMPPWTCRFCNTPDPREHRWDECPGTWRQLHAGGGWDHLALLMCPTCAALIPAEAGVARAPSDADSPGWIHWRTHHDSA